MSTYIFAAKGCRAVSWWLHIFSVAGHVLHDFFTRNSFSPVACFPVACFPVALFPVERHWGPYRRGDQDGAQPRSNVANPFFLVSVLLFSVVGGASSSSAQPLVDATYVDSGWYNDLGFHGPTNQNYLTARAQTNTPGLTTFYGFHVFDVPDTDTIVSAELEIYTYDVVGTHSLQIKDVVTPIATLLAGGTGLTGIRDDLANGASYGTATVTNAMQGMFIKIPLNAQAVAALNAARGNQFAMGFSTPNPTLNDGVFANSSLSPERLQNRIILTIGNPQASEAAARFMNRRADLILANGPGIDRSIGRLNNASAAAGATVSGFNGLAPNSPFGLQVDFDRLLSERQLTASFSTGLRQIEQSAARRDAYRVSLDRAGGVTVHGNDPTGLDVWVEGHIKTFNDSLGGDGQFAIGYLGVDYVVSRSLMLGMVAQFDWMQQDNDALKTEVDGIGWMVGPNIAARLSENLFFDGQTSWGLSHNTVDTASTNSDNFETERWLARGRLTGDHRVDNLTFRPSITVAYIRDEQKSFTDSLGATIPSQTITLGQAKFGPKIFYSVTDESGMTFAPHASIEAVWNFAGDNGVLTDQFISGSGEIRGKGEIGFSMSSDAGIRFAVSGNYDGIGDDGFEAYGMNINLAIPVN